MPTCSIIRYNILLYVFSICKANKRRKTVKALTRLVLTSISKVNNVNYFEKKLKFSLPDQRTDHARVYMGKAL